MCRSKYQVSNWIRPAKRLAIYLRDGMKCQYCGRDLHGVNPRDITLDHITPKSRGGSNKCGNLVTSCRSCNSQRQDAPLEEWASCTAVKRIIRQLGLDLTPYKALAKELIRGKGETDVRNS